MQAHSRAVVDGDLVDAVYRAALEPADWDDVMTLMGRRFPSSMQAFYFLDRRSRKVRIVRLQGVEANRLAQFDSLYFAADNPFIQVSDRLHRPGVVRTNERVDTCVGREGAIYRSGYYNEWMRPQDFRFTLGTTVLLDADAVANITLMRPAGMGTYTERDVRDFEALSRHMTRAVDVATRLERTEAGPERVAFDALTLPLALLDREGRLRHANPAMEQLLRRRDGLALENGAIVALDLEARVVLSARVLAAADRTDVGPFGAAPVEVRRGAASRLTIEVIPVRSRGGGYLATAGGALLLASEGPAAPRDRVETFRLVHGCTRSEARLAALIVDGSTLRDAAERMGITYGSARVYLKAVFGKVGVRTQAQLVAASRPG